MWRALDTLAKKHDFALQVAAVWIGAVGGVVYATRVQNRELRKQLEHCLEAFTETREQNKRSFEMLKRKESQLTGITGLDIREQSGLQHERIMAQIRQSAALEREEIYENRRGIAKLSSKIDTLILKNSRQ